MALLARVYLVRHGETDENRKHIIQGQLDTLLSSLGLKQAKLVGNALRSIPFDMACSSDLSRAVSVCRERHLYASHRTESQQTTREILVHHPEIALYQEQKELRERVCALTRRLSFQKPHTLVKQHMGALQGKVWENKAQACGLGDDKTMESGAFFAARAESWWFQYILDATASFPRKDGPYHILVTTHGGFIGTLIRTLLRRKKARWAEGVVAQRCLNTSVTIIEIDMAGQGLIIQSCDVTHLEGLMEGKAVEDNADVDDDAKHSHGSVALPLP